MCSAGQSERVQAPERVRGQRTRLVLEGVEPLPPLGDLGDVVLHDPDGRINLLLDRLGLAPARAGRRSGSGTSARLVRVRARDVRVILVRPAGELVRGPRASQSGVRKGV